MPSEITAWLDAREQEAKTELEFHEREAENRRGALAMIRKWRESESSEPAPSATSAETPAQDAPDPTFDAMPRLDDANDPTGRRRAIWRLADEKRGRYGSNKQIYDALRERGWIGDDVPLKDVEVTTRRMAKRGQLDKGGRGRFGLPEKTTEDRSLELPRLVREGA